MRGARPLRSLRQMPHLSGRAIQSVHLANHAERRVRRVHHRAGRQLLPGARPTWTSSRPPCWSRSPPDCMASSNRSIKAGDSVVVEGPGTDWTLHRARRPMHGRHIDCDHRAARRRRKTGTGAQLRIPNRLRARTMIGSAQVRKPRRRRRRRRGIRRRRDDGQRPPTGQTRRPTGAARMARARPAFRGNALAVLPRREHHQLQGQIAARPGGARSRWSPARQSTWRRW